VQDVGVAPGQVLGALLGSVLTVDLLIDSALVVHDMGPESSHDGVTSRLTGRNEVLSGSAVA